MQSKHIGSKQEYWHYSVVKNSEMEYMLCFRNSCFAICNDILSAIYMLAAANNCLGIMFGEKVVPVLINNNFFNHKESSIPQSTLNTPTTQGNDSSSQKHYWTFEEDKTCCRIFIETFVKSQRYCTLEEISRKVLSIYPHIKLSSIKMKFQNIKQLCFEYGIKDWSSIKPLNNYSTQNLHAMLETLKEFKILV